MTREIGPELVARIRHVADSLEAIARGEVDSPQPFAAACNGDVVPLYRTPQTNATPGECSVLGSYEKSDENRMNTNTDRDATPAEGSVQDRCTLTDEERDAIEGAIAAEHGRGAWQWANTLRKLLERTK
jgi:hypothetical protein